MRYLAAILSVLAITSTTVLALSSDVELFAEVGLYDFYENLQTSLDDSRDKLAWIRTKAGRPTILEDYEDRIAKVESDARDIARYRGRWLVARRKAVNAGNTSPEADAELEKLERKEGKVIVQAKRIQTDMNKEIGARRKAS